MSALGPVWAERLDKAAGLALGASPGVDDVLANAPAAEHGFFGVPKVIE